MDDVKNDISVLVLAHTKDLFCYALAKLNQKELAEDLVQDTFVAACQSHHLYTGKSSAKTWLFSILKNKIADFYRNSFKKGKEVSFLIIEEYFDSDHQWKAAYRPLDWGNENELLDNPDFQKMLETCLENLPQKWSAAIRLKYLEEANADKICKELDLSKTNFWQIIHRARLQLRNCLELKWAK